MNSLPIAQASVFLRETAPKGHSEAEPSGESGLSWSSVWLPASAGAQNTRLCDGRWAVIVPPQEGACVQHQIEVRVTDGVIGPMGDFGLLMASGEVGPQGQVDARIGALGIATCAQGRRSGAEGWQRRAVHPRLRWRMDGSTHLMEPRMARDASTPGASSARLGG